MTLIAITWTVVFLQGVQQFFIEFHKTVPFLQPTLIPLNGIPALECIDWPPRVVSSASLMMLCCPLFQVTAKGIKQDKFWCRPLQCSIVTGLHVE